MILGDPKCPVASFEKYLSKLSPFRGDLWQRPRDSYLMEDASWYANTPIGKNPIAGFMSEISNIGKLSQRYTNHSIRATSITLLDDAEIPDRHIIKVSGHKNASSLKSYSHHVSEQKKRKISDILVNATSGPVIPMEAHISDIENIFNEPFDALELTDSQNNLLLQDLAQCPSVSSDIPTYPQQKTISSANNQLPTYPQQKTISSANNQLYRGIPFQPIFGDNCNVNIYFN